MHAPSHPASRPTQDDRNRVSVAHQGIAELRHAEKRRKAKYQTEPSMFDALSYDAVYMVKQAAEDTKAKSSVDVKDGLAKLKGFRGATGDISVDKDHNPVKDAVVVKLENGKEASETIVKPD